MAKAMCNAALNKQKNKIKMSLIALEKANLALMAEINELINEKEKGE